MLLVTWVRRAYVHKASLPRGCYNVLLSVGRTWEFAFVEQIKQFMELMRNRRIIYINKKGEKKSTAAASNNNNKKKKLSMLMKKKTLLFSLCLWAG